MNQLQHYDYLLDPVFVINKDWVVSYCNVAAAKLANSSPDELSNKSRIGDLFQDSKNELLDKLVMVKQSGEASGYSEINLDGAFNVCVHPIEIDGETYYSVICRDMAAVQTLNEKDNQQLDKLQEYSKSLEDKIEKGTCEIRRTSKLLHAMLDSLGQGFIVIDSDGKCSDIYTKSCLDMLEVDPKGKHLAEILSLKDSKAEEINLWLNTLFQESLPFDSLKELGPMNFAHSKSREIFLDFYPIRAEDNSIQNIVMVATDKTSELKAQAEMEREKKYSQMILKLVKNREQFTQFLSQLEPKINVLVKFTKAEDKDFSVPKILRFLHTIEGEAGMFNIEVIREYARRAQQVLEPLKTGWAEDFESIRGEFNVEVAKMAYGFENFIRKNSKTFRSLGVFGVRKIEVDESRLNIFFEQLKQSNVPKPILDQFLSDFIYQPVRYYLSHYEDLVKSVAGKQGKEIPNVEFVDCDIKVDGRRFNKVFNSLVHVFRNAVDHGIEPPEERLSLGKPMAGTVSIECSTFFMDKKYLQIAVRDDGRGIDADLIKNKLDQKGFDVNYSAMSDYDLTQSLFMPGFSSMDEIGEFSGRGIGMDAVKKEVEAIGGEVSFKSLPGAGSTLTIVIPFESDEKMKIAG